MFIDYQDMARSEGAFHAFKQACLNRHWDSAQEIRDTNRLSPEQFDEVSYELHMADRYDDLYDFMFYFAEDLAVTDLKNTIWSLVGVSRSDIIEIIIENAGTAFDTEDLRDIQHAALQMGLAGVMASVDSALGQKEGRQQFVINLDDFNPNSTTHSQKPQKKGEKAPSPPSFFQRKI